MTGEGEMMNIIAISDIHGETAFVDPASDLISAADLTLICGDISGSGDTAGAEKVLVEIEKYTSKIIAVHGNWDNSGVLNMLEERGYSLHAKGRILNGIGFFGVGGSSVTPMKTPSEYKEEEIEEYLYSGFISIAEAEQKILVSHCPPRNTRDRTFLGIRGGSRSIRKFIDNNKIDLCVCGHIHEASGTEVLNSCIVANSGSFKKGKFLQILSGDGLKVFEGKLKKIVSAQRS